MLARRTEPLLGAAQRRGRAGKTARRRQGGGPPKAGGAETWELHLYVAGRSANSELARQNLKRICDAYLDVPYEIKIIDLLRDPKRARRDGILAVPTLIRKRPSPVRKIVGNLSDTEQILAGLDLYGPTARASGDD